MRPVPILQKGTMIKLDLPKINDQDFPVVSVVVPTKDRPEFHELIMRNWNSIDYPRDKLRLIVADNSKTKLKTHVFVGDNVHYFHSNAKTIGKLRNELCKKVNEVSEDSEYIVHMDDDDWFPSESVATRVRALLHLEKVHNCRICVGCSVVNCYDLLTNQFFEASDPVDTCVEVVDKSTPSTTSDPAGPRAGAPTSDPAGPRCRTLSESTMAYSREYWMQQQWDNTSTSAECLKFMNGRLDTVFTLPSVFVVTQFSHRKNTITRRLGQHEQLSEERATQFRDQLSVYDHKIFQKIQLSAMQQTKEYIEAVEFIRRFERMEKEYQKRKIFDGRRNTLNPFLIEYFRTKVCFEPELWGGCPTITYYCGRKPCPIEMSEIFHRITEDESNERVVNIYCDSIEGDQYSSTDYCTYIWKWWNWLPLNKQTATIVDDPNLCKYAIESNKNIILIMNHKMDISTLDPKVKIVVKSEFHKKYLDLVDHPNVHVIPRGIHHKLFKRDSRQENSLLCMGPIHHYLNGVLKMLPIIRQDVPNVRLYIITKDYIEDTDDIIRLRPAESDLHEIISKMDLFLYPTYYPESDGYFLKLAMANGVIPIVTPAGAFSNILETDQQLYNDTCTKDFSLKEGTTYFNNYVKEVVRVLKSERIDRESLIRRSVKYNMQNIIEKWLKILTE